ncbi:ribosomal-processing cysteine protease Prp [Desemzia sp. C1]|uniref:ribosomal-processing cysteine protease Prp n=1 Tax=Desemzia sp. C1 TaxID=2892016 RepID=UPI0024154390|nr:ribosomal-processing cysteine protease Prp [Desemzia sp. C1]
MWRLKRTEKMEIASFKVEGHAGFAPSDRDIVCAAVSSLVIGTVNVLRQLTDAEFDAEVDDDVVE